MLASQPFRVALVIHLPMLFKNVRLIQTFLLLITLTWRFTDIEEVGYRAHMYAELGGRVEVNFIDVKYA